jgi:hypothetical protein
MVKVPVGRQCSYPTPAGVVLHELVGWEAGEKRAGSGREAGGKRAQRDSWPINVLCAT